MNSLKELQRNWDGLAQADPLWAICTDPEKRNSRWTREEFFATGRKEIEAVLGYAARIGICIDKAAPAFDFGCGAGRLTRALGKYFPECLLLPILPKCSVVQSFPTLPSLPFCSGCLPYI